MNYLDFVEEQKSIPGNLTLFQKVLIGASRAKDLYEERKPVLKELEQHKPVSVAVYEVNRELIDPIIQKKTEDELYYNDDTGE